MEKLLLIYQGIKQFSFFEFIKSLLQVFGILWLSVQITSFFFNKYGWADTIQSGWWLFFIVGIILGLYSAWPKLSVKERILGTDIDIGVRIGNIFSLPYALIIGSNTTFDTSMEENIISPKSVQGQFTKRYCSSINLLDKLIEDSLAAVPPKAIKDKNEKPFGKLEEYELGTVAPIELNGKKVYFVAVAILNQHKVASVEREAFLDSLPKMWADIRYRGGFEPLCCPVLGSGFSRLNMTREELIKEIIKSFIVATSEAKFSERLVVIISPNDFSVGHIDLKRIKKFLEYECVYGRSITKSKMRYEIGTPIT